MKSSLVLTGVGLRAPHFLDFVEKNPNVAWLEVHSENYFTDGGKPIYFLEKIRKNYPISLHGVSLSLGSSDEINWFYLKKLLDLIIRIEPCLISDHLSWSSLNGHYFHDLFPLPYTEEVLNHVVSRITQVQEFLHRQILIENISHYIQFENSTFDEANFLTEVAKRSGCGILLDINNIYVNATNFGFNPEHYIKTIPSNLIQEIHLAGFTSVKINHKETLIDSHNRLIVPAVWDLFRMTIQQKGPKPTIVEWDKDIPSIETLCLEAYRAEKHIKEIYGTTKLTG